MKTVVALVVLVYALSPVLAQQVETRKVGSFSGVRSSEGVDVYLKHGDTEEVRVEVTGTDPGNVITEISGSYLKVHMRDGGRFRSVDATVYVTYTTLDKLSASSAGNIFSDGVIRGRTLDLNASSAGSIEVELDVTTVNVSCSSAGDVELKGRAHKLTADASSAGEIDADELDADEVVAEASSGASIKVSVRKSLEARASSAGSIRYRGNPDRSHTNSSSGGSVKKSN